MDLQGHGIGGVMRGLDGVFRGVHFNSDAEGLVIVVDSDDEDLHELDHDFASGKSGSCRLCKCQNIIDRARKQFNKARPHGQELKVAIGLAVPAIEAWYLVGKDPQVGEASWKASLASGRRAFTRPQLKKLVYRTDRPSLEHSTEHAVNEARRIISDTSAIEAAFPAGFGTMAREIRSWTWVGK